MRSLSTKEEFESLLAEAARATKLLVVDFTATWCGPCQRIAPLYEDLAKEFPQVLFVKVDVDDNQETAQQCNVSAMPTFKGYRDRAEVFSIRGADIDGLRQQVSTNAGSKFEGQGMRLGGSAAATSGMSEREKRLAALEKRGLGGGASTSPAGSVGSNSSYMAQVNALLEKQSRSPPKIDPAVAATVAAATSPVAGSLPSALGGTAAMMEAMAAKARATAEAEVKAAAAAAKAASDARLAAAVGDAAPIDIGDAAAGFGHAGHVPQEARGGAEEEEDAMLAAAIAASLQTGDESHGTSTVAASAVPLTSVPVAAAPMEPSSAYGAEKEQLRAMGFSDNDANQLALESTNGDVQRALEVLLG